jgi:CheY-like chemotaxis protein
MTETPSVKKTVMICDDDNDLLQLFKLALNSKYDILAASSGKECIEQFVQQKREGKNIDLLLLDYRLKDMVGEQVARKIKELGCDNIVLISAYDLDNNMLSDLIEGKYITQVLTKPISLQILKDKIGQIMEATMPSLTCK